MWKLLKNILPALQAGKIISNPAEWKHKQNVTSALIAVLGFILAALPLVGVKLEISAEDVAAIAGGIAIILGVLNGIITTATSKKVGLSSGAAPSSPDKPRVEGVGD
jgi:uncharacterized membrane protein